MTHDQLANEEFERAHMRAFWRRIGAWLTGTPNALLSYDDVRQRLPILGQHYCGLQQVPVKNIVGSVGRYRDFDRAFFPTQTFTKDRWVNIIKAHYQDIILPPVELYKVGEIYFVKDGNHRISVARERGQAFVDAYVTEVDVPVPVTLNTSLDSLTLEQARQRFLEESTLPQTLPEAQITTQLPEQYDKLLEHIAAHQWYLGERRGQPVTRPQALHSWYANVYQPVVRVLQQHNLLKLFPECSEADLYLWTMDYQWFLRHAARAESADTAEANGAALRRMLEENPQQPARRLAQILLSANWVNDFFLQQEYAVFMEHTHLNELRPQANLQATIPGCYERLLEHIAAHRWYLGEQRKAEIPYNEAVVSWYDSVYQPIVHSIREQNLLAEFPNRAETDLYLWVIDRQWHLRQALGEDVAPQQAIEQLSEEKSPLFRKMLRALLQAGQLFGGEFVASDPQLLQELYTPPPVQQD